MDTGQTFAKVSFYSALLGSIFCYPLVSSATTAINIEDDALADQADAIVCGVVKRISSGRMSRGLYTFVTLKVTDVLKGDISGDKVTLRELGGRAASVEQKVFGSPEYIRGEEVCSFVQVDPEGYLRTLQMLLGKFSVSKDATTGEAVVSRDLSGAAVFDIKNGAVRKVERDTRRNLRAFKNKLRSLAQKKPGRKIRSKEAPEALAESVGTSTTSGYTFMGNVRWFLPDSGTPLRYKIDPAGDSKLGFSATQSSVNSAFQAWTNVSTSSITLQSDGTAAATANGFCDGTSKIVFNDPFNEVTNPNGCGGILAIGGYCAGGALRKFNGIDYREIFEGDIIFNNGWSGCSFWNATNVAEIATHELGHTIGLGHSTDQTATMYSQAHFDGRGAGLKADDIAGVSFLYPDSSSPPPPPPPSSDSGAYRIGGTIKFEGTTIPLKEATVTLYSYKTKATQLTISGSGGRYTFRDLASGTYRSAPAQREGYSFIPVRGNSDVEISNRSVTNVNFVIRCVAPFRFDKELKLCVR